MKVAIVGDVHGDASAAVAAIYRASDLGAGRIFFVGDFGYNFTDRFVSALETASDATGLTIEWIDGNHENFDYLNSIGFNLGLNFRYHQRGSVEYIDGVKFMFLGGATSVDRQWRATGIEWWPQEQLTFPDITRGISNGPADIILSHDAPYLPPMMNDDLAPFPKIDLKISAMHRQLYRMIYEAVHPKAVFHGHYHILYTDEVVEPWDTVTIQGLNCNGNALMEYMTIIDTEDYL